jgi:hypothetical protein
VPLAQSAVVTVNGEKAAAEDLKAGQSVRLQIRRDTVIRVEATKSKEAEKPVEKLVEKPVEKPVERPFPVDPAIVGKDEKYPDLGGRVLSVFDDGPSLLVTIQQVAFEVPFYIPKDAKVTFVGLEKPEQKPTVGYLVYVWLKAGSKDTAEVVRFGRSR